MRTAECADFATLSIVVTGWSHGYRFITVSRLNKILDDPVDRIFVIFMLLEFLTI